MFPIVAVTAHTAEESVFLSKSVGLFLKKTLKIRINPFKHYNIGGIRDDFTHVFANSMVGRNTEQKKDLSEKVVQILKSMFPEVFITSINIHGFEKSTYCNKSMMK